MGENLGYELVGKRGFEKEIVPGGQHRYISPEGMFSQRIAFVVFRGRRDHCHFQVNQKGERTRDLTRTNSLLFAHQIEYANLAEERDYKDYKTVFIVTEPQGQVINAYLVVSMELSKSGARMRRIEDYERIVTIDFDDFPSPGPRTGSGNGVDDDDIIIEDRDVAHG